MYCKKCGMKNSKMRKTCQYCGEKLSENSSNNPEVGRQNHAPADSYEKKAGKKKVIVICVAVAIVLLLLISIAIAAIFILNNKNSEEYDRTIKKADEFMENQQYKKAEKEYFAAIDLNQEEAYPYLRISDIYIIDYRYNKANEILLEGQENAGGKEIERKLEEISPYVLYEDYLVNTAIPEEGITETDKEISYASVRPGLISGLIGDFDKDESPDLLTIGYGDSTATEITMKLYTVDSGEVELADENTRVFRDGGNYISADGSRFDVYLKEYENKTFLVISGEILKSNSGYGVEETYRLADVIEPISEADWSIEPVTVSYSVNDKEVAYYSSYTSVEHDQAQYDAEISEGAKAVADEMSLFGFDRDRVISSCDGLFNMYIKCDEDQNEKYLCFIRHGIYEDDGSVDLTDSGVTRYIKDYTDFFDTYR